jgi:hypothetical protein
MDELLPPTGRPNFRRVTVWLKGMLGTKLQNRETVDQTVEQLP